MVEVYVTTSEKNDRRVATKMEDVHDFSVIKEGAPFPFKESKSFAPVNVDRVYPSDDSSPHFVHANTTKAQLDLLCETGWEVVRR